MKKVKNLIFIFILKKFKTIELNNWNKNIITTFVIKIINKIIGNETDKKKINNEYFYCNKKNHCKNECHQWLNIDENKKWIKKQFKTDRDKSANENAVKTANTTQNNDSNVESTWMMMIFENVADVSMKTKNVWKNWIIGSNAKKHMTSNKNLFLKLNKQKTTIIVINEIKLKSPKWKNIFINLNNHLIIMINVLYVSKFNCNLLLIFVLKKKNIEMHIKLTNITLIQNDTTIIIKIFKKRIYYLKSTSKQQALINQNDLIWLIATLIVATPTGPARQSENSDIKFIKINKYFKWHVRMKHEESDHLLTTIQTVNDINKNIEINTNKCVICILSKITKMMNKLLFLRITKPLKRVFSNFWKNTK